MEPQQLIADLQAAVLDAGDQPVKGPCCAKGDQEATGPQHPSGLPSPRRAELRVERLPPAHIEREYLRLHEIPVYLDACDPVYRPLAEVLIATAMRISEALALHVGDVELEGTGGFVTVYRSRKLETIGSTKSDRFRSVEIGPGLARVLGDQLARRAELDDGDQPGAYLFVMPVRTRHHGRGRWASAGKPEPLDRTTVSREWHKEALEDAGLRPMALHCLRQTAAAARLAAGNSLMYVQRQLGHSDLRAGASATRSSAALHNRRSRPVGG